MRHESHWTKEVSYMQLTKHNWFAPRIVRAIILYLTVILLWSSPGEAASIEQKQDGGLAYRKVLDYSPTVVPGPVAPRQYGQGVHEFKNYHVKDEVSFYIPPDDIQGFVIEKAPVMRRDEAHSPWYHVTFSVSRKAGQQHAAFVNQHGGETYEISLAGNKLTIAPFMPDQNFQANSKFTFAVEAANVNELRAMFAPFKGKIIWNI